jgi:hypothetical protein
MQKGVLMPPSRLLFALLILGITSAVTAADDLTQRVFFENGATATLTGSVTGYRSMRYLFTGRAGQALSVSFTPSKKTLYYNVVQGTRMLRDGSSADPEDWTAQLTADGEYVIDVYFKSADARRNATATFILTLSLR